MKPEVVRQVHGINITTDPAEACRLMANEDLIGFDTETTGFSPWRDELALMQFYGDKTGTLAIIQIRDGVVPDVIKSLFSDKSRTFIVHNGVNFDIQFLHNAWVPWRNVTWYDTLVGETVIASTGRRGISKSLRASAKRRLGVEIDKTIDHGQWGSDHLSDKQLEYAAADVIGLPALMRAHQAEAERTGQSEALAMEMILMPSMAGMRINGLPVVPSVIASWRKSQMREADAAAEKLYAIFGSRFNLGSHVQLKSAIEKRFGFHLESTAVEKLMDVISNPKMPKDMVECLELVLAYRHPMQRLKTYDEEWVQNFVIDGFVHGKFWQCSADTGRITGSEPSLQVWPRDSRWVIGNMDGITIVASDYSQIEIRIAAEIANDDVLLEKLSSNDVHRAIASSVYHLPEDEIVSLQRKNAKALSFALLFDGTPRTLYRHSKESGGSMTFEECVTLERSFFNEFQGLKTMRGKARAWAGDRRPTAEIRLPNGLRRLLVGNNKRASVILNTMVQGTAAVGMKYGIIEADRRGLLMTSFGGIGASVHDELVAWVDDKVAEEYKNELCESMIVGMQKVMKSEVKVDPKVGKFWAQ